MGNSELKPNATAVTKRHFHTFDALRFFACFKVFLQHVPVSAFAWFNYVKSGGGIGVQFFFVLSGFLITYIICEEKNQTGNLNLKHFFMRRVLRIWPLFYLMIGVAFITPLLLNYINLPNSDVGYQPEWWMSLLFLENYKMMIEHNNPNISPLGVMWSLCIEEHFYIVWGLVLYLLPLKHLPKFLVASIVASPLLRLLYVSNNIPTSDLPTNIDLFAYGAIPAYLLIVHPSALNKYISAIPKWAKLLFVACLITVVLHWSQAKGDGAYVAITSYLGILFSMLIALTLSERNSLKIGDGTWLAKLGLYTYGFYLYHTLVLNLFRRIFEKMGWDIDTALYAILFTVITFAISILCSMASYHWFEKPFLKLKRHFR